MIAHKLAYDGRPVAYCMVDPELLDKLRQGTTAWIEWRLHHPDAVLDLAGAHLEKADLRGVQLSGAALAQSRLAEADFSGADLSGTHLAGAFLTRTNLSKATLATADMRWAHLTEARLTEAHLEMANLQWTDLRKAELARASLFGTLLGNADMGGADLTEADLTAADLRETNLNGAQLMGCNFDGAAIAGTVFGANDLSTARGLETVRHMGPSVIGIETIFLSKGKIPEPFLRGCGVPNDFITFIKSFTTNPIEFYSCFISYSTKDEDFADRLYADLQNKGVRCWFAPHDVQGGKKLHEQIDEAIRLHDKLLLILSPYSMESEWVKTEIAKARKRELRDKRRVLFPIRLAPFETLRDWECFDADTGKDSAREIREYFIPDFSNWKNHDSYQEAFQRLISDLKASDSK